MSDRTRPTRRFSDRLLSLAGLRVVLWAIAAHAFLPEVLSDDPYKLTAYHDDHYVYQLEEAAKETIARYHELPTWNPYYCGGVPGIANPQDGSLAPDFLLRVVFGVGPGRRLAVLLFVMLGMEGLFRLARKHDASVLGAATGALAFAMCGTLPMHVRFGWSHFFTYQLFPWIALCFELGVRRRAWAVLGGVFLAWMILCGGTYAAPYAGLLVAALFFFETARVVVAPRGSERWFSPFLSAAILGLVAVGLTAIRTLPLLRIVFGVRRSVSEKEAFEPLSLFVSMWSPQFATTSEQYIGLGVVALAVLALLLADRAGARFFALALIFGSIAVGQWSDFAPWVFLHKLPVYSQLGTPSRILIVALMFLSLGASRGLTRLEDAPTWIAGQIRRLRKRRLPILARLVTGVFGAVSAGYLGYFVIKGLVASTAIQPGTAYVMEGPLRYWDEFRQSRGNRWDSQVWLPASRGSIECFEEMRFFEAAGLRGDLPAEEFVEPGNDAIVRRVSWSPTRIVLDVNAKQAPTRIVVNQNYDVHWTSSEGNVTMAPDGLLAIDVPAGHRTLTLAFRDGLVTTGALVAIATLLGVLALLARCVSEGLARTPWRGLLPPRGVDAKPD